MRFKSCSLLYMNFFIKGHNELYDLMDSYFSFWFDDYSFYIQYDEWQQKNHKVELQHC
jgi:hypothetical protein